MDFSFQYAVGVHVQSQFSKSMFLLINFPNQAAKNAGKQHITNKKAQWAF